MKKILIFAILIMTSLSAYLIYGFFFGGSPDVTDEYVNFPGSGGVRDIDPDIVGKNPEVMTTILKSGEPLEVYNVQLGKYDLGDNKTFVMRGGLNESNPKFALTYFSNYDFYQINLETEPLGEVRRLAENELMQILGVNEDEMCRLNLSVRTNIYVNYHFGGDELGLSFCPGSIQLE